MELTQEILESNGFVNNHPERPLGKYYAHDPKGSYKIHVEKTYYPQSNKIGWMASAWKTNRDDVIIKRSSASIIQTVEELQMVIDLCDINLLVYVK